MAPKIKTLDERTEAYRNAQIRKEQEKQRFAALTPAAQAKELADKEQEFDKLYGPRRSDLSDLWCFLAAFLADNSPSNARACYASVASARGIRTGVTPRATDNLGLLRLVAGVVGDLGPDEQAKALAVYNAGQEAYGKATGALAQARAQAAKAESDLDLALSIQDKRENGESLTDEEQAFVQRKRAERLAKLAK
ncbi:MAG: hypothetical protein WCV84_06100 [Patescibacteria group bacterium]